MDYVDENANAVSYDYSIDGDTLTMTYETGDTEILKKKPRINNHEKNFIRTGFMYGFVVCSCGEKPQENTDSSEISATSSETEYPKNCQRL